MKFYRVRHLFLVDYSEYNDLAHMVDYSFNIPHNTLQSAGLHILTHGVNNLTLSVL